MPSYSRTYSKKGIKAMTLNRQNKPFKNLTNGPAKLVQALNIKHSWNGISYNESPVFVTETDPFYKSTRDK